MHHKDISNSIFEIRQFFPGASCLLMMILLDEFSISNAGYSGIILQ